MKQKVNAMGKPLYVLEMVAECGNNETITVKNTITEFYHGEDNDVPVGFLQVFYEDGFSTYLNLRNILQYCVRPLYEEVKDEST